MGYIWTKKVSVIERPFFAKFKKHKCAICGSELKLFKVARPIKKGSPEAQGKLFGNKIMSDFDYIISIFECLECGNKLSISDQYFIEKPHKKDRRNYDNYHQYLQSFDRQNGTNKYNEHLESLKRQKHS